MELGRKSNVSATEWSWSALIFDMDNDGLKDIFISNGIYKDLLDRDYLTYEANEETIKNRINSNEKEVINKLIDAMPSNAVPNAIFRNLGNFNFENKSKDWGLNLPSFSNGSAYGDLDNDGDLDLFAGEASGTMNFWLNEGSADSPDFQLVSDTYLDIDVGRRSFPTFADLDGDGVSDIAVGAPGDDTGGNSFGAVYMLNLATTGLDFGDAPTSTQSSFPNSYPVTLAQNGARHVAIGPRLGATRDIEVVGTPGNFAMGDDNIGTPDDEAGITFYSNTLVVSGFVCGNRASTG